MTETPAPVAASLINADSTLKEKIKQEVYRAAHQKYSEGQVMIAGSTLMINGEK